MLASIKDLIVTIATVILLAHSSGRQDWLWKQIAILRHEVLREVRQDWGCPSIFRRKSCLQLPED